MFLLLFLDLRVNEISYETYRFSEEGRKLVFERAKELESHDDVKYVRILVIESEIDIKPFR